MQPSFGLEALGRNSRPMEVRIPKLFLSAASRYFGPLLIQQERITAMPELVIVVALFFFTAIVARAMNYFFPPDYHQRIEEKYNK